VVTRALGSTLGLHKLQLMLQHVRHSRNDRTMGEEVQGEGGSGGGDTNLATHAAIATVNKLEDIATS
jgi:hypothetical protein